MAAVLVSPVESSDIIEETEKDSSPVSGSVPIPSSSSTAQVASGTPQKPILFLGFNQDSGRFACGTHSGFRVYDCHPFREAIRREFSDNEESSIGSVAFIELLFRSNIMAIVGGGPTPKYPPNKVMIWDDQQCRCIGELSFRSEVRAVKLRRDRIVVILEHKIYVYNFADLKLLLQIDTISNKKGLCAISSTSNSVVLACPGITKGQVRVEFNGTKKTKFIPAHDSGLECISLTLDGQLIATASNKGTLIRVFNTHDCTRLQEVRRGVDRAEIYSIAFSGNAQFLAVSSDKGTVHVFRLKREIENGNPSAQVGGAISSGNFSHTITNAASTLSFMKGVLPKYFSSEWSICQFRLPDEVKSFVTFGPEKQTLIIVGSDASFYRCLFDDAHGGEMVQQEYETFL